MFRTRATRFICDCLCTFSRGRLKRWWTLYRPRPPSRMRTTCTRYVTLSFCYVEIDSCVPTFRSYGLNNPGFSGDRLRGRGFTLGGLDLSLASLLCRVSLFDV